MVFGEVALLRCHNSQLSEDLWRKRRTNIPTATLTKPTRWKEILQPVIPMNDISANNTDTSPPRIEPKFPVNCSHPKAILRLRSSVESATRDWIAGPTMESPIPFKPLEIATY